MFSFATGSVEKELKLNLFTAELLLTTLYSLSIYYNRCFELEAQDGVFNLMRVYPISRTSWFLSKYLIVNVFAFVAVFFLMILTTAFIEFDLLQTGAQSQIATILFLAVTGLSPLGILLSAITLKAKGRSLLFPLLYFPLTIPVLLSSAELIKLVAIREVSLLDTEWSIVLAGFNAIYFIISLMLFDQIAD